MFIRCKDYLEEHTVVLNYITFNIFYTIIHHYAQGGHIPMTGLLFDNTRYTASYSPEFDSLTRIGRLMDEIT